MPPIFCLSDAGLEIVFGMARSIPSQDRSNFLELLAEVMPHLGTDDDAVMLGCLLAQRRFFAPTLLMTHRGLVSYR
jgi:hypothetical protein